jgi:hypothetical protein
VGAQFEDVLVSIPVVATNVRAAAQASLDKARAAAHASAYFNVMTNSS